MANRPRGEIPIKLNGQDYTLRPTFQCLNSIADRTGANSIILLSRRMASGDIRLTDMAIVIQEGIKAAGQEDLDLDKIGEMIVQDGIVNLSSAVLDFVTIAIQGVSPPKKTEKMSKVPIST